MAIVVQIHRIHEFFEHWKVKWKYSACNRSKKTNEYFSTPHRTLFGELISKNADSFCLCL